MKEAITTNTTIDNGEKRKTDCIYFGYYYIEIRLRGNKKILNKKKKKKKKGVVLLMMTDLATYMIYVYIFECRRRVYISREPQCITVDAL